MAWSDRTGCHNFVFLGDGRVEDEDERDESGWEIIMRNWDLREFRLQGNLRFLIQQVRVVIRWGITPISVLLNPFRHVVPLISHIRSYPPYRSDLHPPSLILIHNSTIITKHNL